MSFPFGRIKQNLYEPSVADPSALRRPFGQLDRSQSLKLESEVRGKDTGPVLGLLLDIHCNPSALQAARLPLEGRQHPGSKMPLPVFDGHGPEGDPADGIT